MSPLFAPRMFLQMFFKRFMTVVLLFGAAAFFGAVMADESRYDEDDEMAVEPALVLPIAQDLAALGETSRLNGVPILLMYSSEDCSHCKRLESEVLGPMRLTGIDPKQLIVRKVRLDAYETLRLFSGKKRNAESYAREQDISVVPTVALVDENGNDLVPKIVGYNTPGIYEAYLDEAIKVSGMLLNQRKTIKAPF